MKITKSTIIFAVIWIFIITSNYNFNVECIPPADNPHKAKIIENITTGYK